MTTFKIGILVGSLRKESFSRKTAQALMNLAPPALEMEPVDIGNLQIYNQDFDDEGNPTAEWTAFREQMKKYDGFLLITPEYNRSVPALLKNALDVGSRPYGSSVWDGKPAAVVSVSIGGLSGFGANHHLRQSLVFLNVPTMQQPEAYIGNAATLFDTNGELINENTRNYFNLFLEKFAEWVATNSSK